MKRRITKNRYVLFILVFFISLGFAYLSANLNILGALSYNAASFDVHFDDLVLDSESYEGAVLPNLNQDKDTISMNFSFDKPGDKLVYTADIINAGTIDAQLGDLNITNNLSSENADLLDLSIKYLDGIDVKSGDVILNGTRKTIKVIVGYSTDIEVSDLPTEVVPFTIEIGPSFDQCNLDNIKTATFIDSGDLNTYMKSLKDDEEHIYKFIRSEELKNGLTNDNIVSTDDSSNPIYKWFEGSNQSIYGLGTIFWYCDADIVFLNESAGGLFYGFEYLDDVSGLYSLNLVPNSSLASFFKHCYNLKNIDPIKHFDMKNVNSLYSLFYNCSSINDFSPLTNWDISNVTDISYLFYGCANLTDLSTISSWDTTNVIEMKCLFLGCTNLTNISPLSDWDLSKIESLDSMFDNCSSLTDISPLGNWDMSGVKVISYMFSGCASLSDITTLSNWNVSNVYSMSGLFYKCSSISNFSPISGWNVSKVIYLNSTFYKCDSLTNLSFLSNWNVGNVEKMRDTFARCFNLSDISGISGWNVSKVEDMFSLFETSYHISDLSPLTNWNVSKVTNMKYMFKNLLDVEDATCLNGWSINQNLRFDDMFINTGLTSSTKPTWYTGNI